MMRKILIAIIILTLATPLGAQVRWLETSHNFGAFHEDDGKVSCEFRFVNDGTEDVAIRSARASCGCTTPSYTKTPIAPGDTASVTVSFNPTGRPGRFSKSVTIDIAGAGPRQMLVIKGVVIGSSNTLRSRYPVEHGPMKLRTTQLPFGTVLKGKAKAAFLEVYNASDAPIVPEWTSLPPHFRLATSGTDTIPPGEQIVYSLTLTPAQTSLYGILTDSAYIALHGLRPLKIDLTAILEEDFSRLTPAQRQKAPVVSLESTRIDFGEFSAVSGPITRLFTIGNAGKSDLLIHRCYTTDPGVTVAVDKSKVKKGGHTTATITVDPQALRADILNAHIQLIANDPDNPITLIRAIGVVR